jgi:hypothetical protein
MTEAASVIIGALVGAAAGIAGGGFAALASVRASQLAARAPLGLVLHQMGNALISMSVTKGTEDYWEPRREFERKWNEFTIQQRILCPSDRIASLMALVGAIGRSDKDPPESLLDVAGQTLEKITQMVGAHSNHLFLFRARREEARIIRRWLASDQSKVFNDTVRTKLAALA